MGYSFKVRCCLGWLLCPQSGGEDWRQFSECCGPLTSIFARAVWDVVMSLLSYIILEKSVFPQAFLASLVT